MDLLISAVNRANLGWKADTCKLQKHHPEYSCEEPTSLAQVSSSTDETEEVDEALFKKSLSAAQAWSKKYATAAEIPDAELPAAYDFRSVHDYDFTTPPRDQGHCGSCYTFGFI